MLRPPAFSYSKNSLIVEKVAAAKLASQYGTPLYVYSANAIKQRYWVFDQAFDTVPHTICYSVKANPNLSILGLLAQQGSGFDVVSGGELERVLVASRKAVRKIVFSGVGKTEAEIDAALRTGILLFNVESASELDLLASRAAKLRKKARIALRVNPDVPAETHPYISTGLREHKFGVAMEEARSLYARAKKMKWLQVSGVSMHIGSQITSVAPFTAAMQRIQGLVTELRNDGHEIGFIDAGGGLGIPYNHDEAAHDDFAASANSYAEAIISASGPAGAHLLLEPGRSIIGPAGVLLTRVLAKKQNGAKRFLVVDAAMNDLIRPSLYSAYHQIVPVERKPVNPATFDVVGPICESGDFFARDRQLPECEEGDLLAILDTGAYGMSLASNYNTRPRAAEVLVEEGKTKVIRKRESVKDLLKAER